MRSYQIEPLTDKSLAFNELIEFTLHSPVRCPTSDPHFYGWATRKPVTLPHVPVEKDVAQ